MASWRTPGEVFQPVRAARRAWERTAPQLNFAVDPEDLPGAHPPGPTPRQPLGPVSPSPAEQTGPEVVLGRDEPQASGPEQSNSRPLRMQPSEGSPAAHCATAEGREFDPPDHPGYSVKV